MPNYKSSIGVDSIYYALVTQDDAADYVAGAPAYFAPAMTITQTPKVTSKVQHADDQPYDSMSAEGETEMDVEITGLPLDVHATILGRVFDSVNKRMFDNGGTPPDLALGFRSLKSDGTYRYYWYLKGSFVAPPEEKTTRTDTPEPKSTKLKFTAIRTIHEFALSGSITDSVKRVVGDTAEASFDASTWFNAVQVPVVGAPDAFTMTSVPIDGATDVVVTADIVLTFTNPLRGNAEDGIALFNASHAAVAHALTLNAARTVVTINPTSSLAAATAHLVVVNGVVDIHGQTLADTVVDFTTAA